MLVSTLCNCVCTIQSLKGVGAISPPLALCIAIAIHCFFSVPLQRVHSTRSYKQALDVYRGHGWTLAEDYIHFSLARHSFSLHRLLDARMAFESLLSHEGSHSPSQQLLYLKDYIYVHRVRECMMNITLCMNCTKSMHRFLNLTLVSCLSSLYL